MRDEKKAAPAQPGGDVFAALDRMDALLDPALGLLVKGISATVAASRSDMQTIRAACAAPAAAAADVLERIANEPPINGNNLAAARVMMAAQMLRDQITQAAPQQEAAIGARCKVIENCKSCQHSVGRQSCALADRKFDSLSRSSAPPEWCPLPLYTAPQPAPVAQGDALNNTVRVPLDSLHADAAYLIGRLQLDTMDGARVVEIIRERIEAAKAALAAQAQEAAPVAQGDALTYEQQRAIRQGHEIAASDSYFDARPQIDNNDRRKVFEAGFERGWDAARTQAKEGGA